MWGHFSYRRSFLISGSFLISLIENDHVINNPFTKKLNEKIEHSLFNYQFQLNGDPDEPDSAEEECVRMRHGKMNDAVCTRTWSGAMRDQVGMGYVCEEHLHIAQGKCFNIIRSTFIWINYYRLNLFYLIKNYGLYHFFK